MGCFVNCGKRKRRVGQFSAVYGRGTLCAKFSISSLKYIALCLNTHSASDLRSSFFARPRHPALLFHYVFDEQQTLSCSVARHIILSRPLCTLSLFLSFFIINPPSYASRLLTGSSRHCHVMSMYFITVSVILYHKPTLFIISQP